MSNVIGYIKRFKTNTCDRKNPKSLPDTTMELNLTGRSKRSTYQQSSSYVQKGTIGSKLSTPRTLNFFNRDKRTEYQPTLRPYLGPTRTIGRSKLTYSESLIDQNKDTRRKNPTSKTQKVPIERPPNGSFTHSNSFLAERTVNSSY